MREILFRGRLTDKSRWVYGCLLNNIYGAVPVIMTDQSVDDAFNLEFEYDHVDEKTVGQYTGLTDKNGKRIFEGDIIQYSIEEDQAVFVGAVKFGEFNPDGGALHNTNVGFYVELVDKEGKRTYMRKDIGFWIKYRKVEIIGNIHDNPELLETA